MKKAVLVMLISALAVTGAMADDFYLGFGGVAMVQDKSVSKTPSDSRCMQATVLI
jgi:hypothetical protein